MPLKRNQSLIMFMVCIRLLHNLYQNLMLLFEGKRKHEQTQSIPSKVPRKTTSVAAVDTKATSTAGRRRSNRTMKKLSSYEFNNVDKIPQSPACNGDSAMLHESMKKFQRKVSVKISEKKNCGESSFLESSMNGFSDTFFSEAIINSQNFPADTKAKVSS